MVDTISRTVIVFDRPNVGSSHLIVISFPGCTLDIEVSFLLGLLIPSWVMKIVSERVMIFDGLFSPYIFLRVGLSLRIPGISLE